MKKSVFAFALAALCMAGQSAQAVTINLTTAVLADQTGNPLADNSTLLLVASTLDADFGNLQTPNLASETSFLDDLDDVILARFPLNSSSAGVPGGNVQPVSFNLGGNLGGNDPLLLVWYVGLDETTNPTAPGAARPFGAYRATDWLVPGDNGATIDLNLLTASAGGNEPDDVGRAFQVTAGVIPEPSTVGLVMLGALFCLPGLRRKNSVR